MFNLKYVCWTINHFVQPLYTAQRQGWTYFSPWQASASTLSWTDVLPLQRDCPLLIWFVRGALCKLLYCTVLYFNNDSSWDDGIVSAGGLFSQVPPLEFELQLSAPVYQHSGGDCGGRKCYPCGEEQKAHQEVWGKVGGKDKWSASKYTHSIRETHAPNIFHRGKCRSLEENIESTANCINNLVGNIIQ